MSNVVKLRPHVVEATRKHFERSLRSIIAEHREYDDGVEDADVVAVLSDLMVEYMDKLDKHSRRAVQAHHIRKMRGAA